MLRAVAMLLFSTFLENCLIETAGNANSERQKDGWNSFNSCKRLIMIKMIKSAKFSTIQNLQAVQQTRTMAWPILKQPHNFARQPC
jgi:hypothetical protein